MDPIAMGGLLVALLVAVGGLVGWAGNLLVKLTRHLTSVEGKIDVMSATVDGRVVRLEDRMARVEGRQDKVEECVERAEHRIESALARAEREFA